MKKLLAITIAIMLMMPQQGYALRPVAQHNAQKRLSRIRNRENTPLNINMAKLETINRHLNSLDALKDLGEEKIGTLSKWIIKHRPYGNRNPLKKALQATGIKGVKKHHQEAIANSVKTGMTRRQFLAGLGISGISAAVAAALAINHFFSKEDSSEVDLFDPNKKNVKFYFGFHSYAEDIGQFADDIKREVRQARRKGYAPVYIWEDPMVISADVTDIDMESAILDALKTSPFDDIFSLPESRLMKSKQKLIEMLDGTVEDLMKMEAFKRLYKDVYDAMKKDREEDARRISKGLGPLPLNQRELSKIFFLVPKENVHLEAENKLLASLKIRTMPEDTDFKNSVRLGLVDAIEQFALQKLLRDRDVSKCVPILRMAWELQAIVHEDREKRIKAQIESIFQDESIKNPVVFVNIGAGHAHMQNDYDSKEYHVRSKQDPLTKIAPSFVGYFFNELIKGKLTEEQIRKIILNRIIFPEICNLLYQGGITESSQWLTIANIFDSMPLERTELMFQEVLENLEPEADFERFLKDIFIWLAENEVTQEKVDAIQKKLEKKLSEPSSAQGNIKEGSGINPGLLPAAALGLFRKRAITAVIDSAA